MMHERSFLFSRRRSFMRLKKAIIIDPAYSKKSAAVSVSRMYCIPLPENQLCRSKYPDRIRVPMSDGKVVTYTISVEMPHPCFEAAIRNIERMEGFGRAQH